MSVRCSSRKTPARRHGDDDARYMFPSTDGDEMITRWDMQDSPPDILITNISMLNAMLSRESGRTHLQRDSQMA